MKKTTRRYYCSTHPTTGKRRIQAAKPFGWDTDPQMNPNKRLFHHPHSCTAASYTEARVLDVEWMLNMQDPIEKVSA